MKRIIGLISAAALLFAAASCQQEQLPAGNESGDVVTATFNVTIPDAMGTKAFGDASGINSFHYQVWEKNLETGAYDKLLLEAIKEFDKTDAEDNKSTELSLKLVRFKTYRVFFWAQGENAKHTWTTDEGLQKVAIDYTPNIENDAFAGSTGDIDASYDFEIEDVTLVRPFAQINFATDDLGEDKGVTAGNLTLKSATVKVPGLATVYDAVNGCGITPENKTFESTALINETFTVGEAEYDGYVLMFYALIDGEATSTVADLEATFVATRNSEDVIVNWTGKSAMNNVAIQPNYRTNFYGSLFTANGSLNVSLDQEFANINDVDLDEAELNEIFADPTVTSYTLKSDVVIEEPLVFAVENRNFTLNLDGHTISNSKGIYNESQNQWSLISVQAGNVTIEGAGTVAALEDDCFAIDVRNGANLTIKDGTYVGNLSAVYVNSGSATIDGGTFSILQLNTGFDNVYCATLNCEDNAYNNGKAAITVNGGSFLGFEPGKSGLNGGKMSPEAKLGTNAPAVVYNEETNYYTVGEEETPAEPVDISAANIGAAATADGLYKVTGEITAAVPSDNSQSEDVTIDNVLTVTVPVPASSSTLAVKSSTETYYKVGGTITVTVEKKDGTVAETAEVTAYEAPEATEPEPENPTFAGGTYWIVSNDMYAMPLTGNYGYIQVFTGAYSDNVFTFTAVEGGYTIQQPDGKYVYMTGSYNSFNVSSTIPDEGHVWTVEANEDGTYKITNVLKTKYVQYDAKYNSYGSYAEAQEEGSMPKLVAASNVTDRPVLKVSATSANVDADITEYSFDITSDCVWTITAGTGVTLDKTSGEGNASVKMTFAANTTSENVVYAATVSATDCYDIDITVTQSGVVAANETKVTFDFTTTIDVLPTGISNSKTAKEEFEIGGYTIGFESTNGYYLNDGYMFVKSTGKVYLPVFSDMKLVKAELSNAANTSKLLKVGIYDVDATAAIAGGEDQTWSTTSSTYTYNLTDTEVNTQYILYNDGKNAQYSKIVLYYEKAE